MLLTVDEVEVARFGATAAVLHAFLEKFNELDGVPIPAFIDEVALNIGIYGDVLKKALKKLENSGYIQIDDGKIYNMIAIDEG